MKELKEAANEARDNFCFLNPLRKEFDKMSLNSGSCVGFT